MFVEMHRPNKHPIHNNNILFARLLDRMQAQRRALTSGLNRTDILVVDVFLCVRMSTQTNAIIFMLGVVSVEFNSLYYILCNMVGKHKLQLYY